MNRIGKGVLQVLIILFLSLFLSKYNTNYNENKKVLTETAIAEYEKDLKEGKEILSQKYQVKEKNYNNSISKIGRSISSIIEKTFHQGFTYFMKYLDYLQHSITLQNLTFLLIFDII